MLFLLLAIHSTPWFFSWNYELLRNFFQLWPHNNLRIAIAYHFIRNPLISTFIYAIAFYFFWWKKDDQTQVRRNHLMGAICACILAVLATGLARPWIAWPAPALSEQFQGLFPNLLWGRGTTNCFPSHSTLVYLTVAIGVFHLNRRVGIFLISFAFLAISLPRIYVGGHYPIDVVGAVVFSLAASFLIWMFMANTHFTDALTWISTRRRWTEALVLFWLCELGEGFRASDTTAHMIARILRHVGWLPS
jgi:undecaprenyl-diphosphatase